MKIRLKVALTSMVMATDPGNLSYRFTFTPSEDPGLPGGGEDTAGSAPAVAQVTVTDPDAMAYMRARFGHAFYCYFEEADPQ